MGGSLESVRLEVPANMVVSAVAVSVENVAVPNIGEQGPSVVGCVEETSDIVVE